MDADVSLGRWLKGRRKALHLTQAELAQLIGCAPVTIAKMEQDRRRPSRELAELLAGHLHLSASEREAFLRLAQAGLQSKDTRFNGRVSPLPVLGSLPVPLTPLIGRAADVAALLGILECPGTRLVTLSGPPGVGKTRLAIQTARDLQAAFSDGIWFVPLATTSDPRLALSAIARVLGVAPTGRPPLMERLKEALAACEALLVLDNFEQIITAGPQVAELLGACGGLKALVTSRVRLHVYGEHEYVLAPLPLPADSCTAVPECLLASEAIQLFVARVAAFRPNFTLTSTNAQAVQEICARLDGLPLAIELAAARLRHLTPRELADCLAGDPLLWLKDGPCDLPKRQQTLHDAIAWSYNLLTPSQQVTFRRLAVFSGGCTSTAARVVCESTAETLHVLASQSLLHQETVETSPLIGSANGTGDRLRWNMLETVRAFAYERLAAAGELAELAERHACYYLRLAEQHWESSYYLVPEDTRPEHGLLAQLDVERDNLLAALRWFRECGDCEGGLRLCNSLWWFWNLTGQWAEGRHWIETFLAAGEDCLAVHRIRGLAGAATLAWRLGDTASAVVMAEEGLELSRATDDSRWQTGMLLLLGKIAQEQGNHTDARASFEQALALSRQIDDASGVAMSLMRLGDLAVALGEYIHARQLLEEGLSLSRALQNTYFLTALLALLGETALATGDLVAARTCFQESLSVRGTAGHPQVVAGALVGMAATLVAGNEPPADTVRCAARLWGAAEALREEIGFIVHPCEQARYDAHMVRARSRLDPAAWESAWSAGRVTPVEQAIACALEIR